MIPEVLAGLSEFFARPASLVLWDLADIVLVAVVLYSMLLLLRGTRAMQMGIGLALVFIGYQGAKRLGLVTLYEMLDTLLTSLVLIIVVVFQHDIRRALVRFGRRPLFSMRGSQENHSIDEVVKAAVSLAHKRIGALIVFERDASLDDFIDEGTILDAAISKELLYSIFIPSFENPMHDGALILREGRVWQAGAFLPLTANPKLDRSLGTRHRAAIGLSEETDAVVVVVSEERGAVSLCFNGNMVRNLDGPSMRKVLLELLNRPVKRRPSRADAEARDRLSQPRDSHAPSRPRESQPPPSQASQPTQPMASQATPNQATPSQGTATEPGAPPEQERVK
jgi:diadenylate cyclase